MDEDSCLSRVCEGMLPVCHTICKFWIDTNMLAVPCNIILQLQFFQMEISYYLSWRRGHVEGRSCNENTLETGELIGGVRDDLLCFAGCERSKCVVLLINDFLSAF